MMYDTVCQASNTRKKEEALQKRKKKMASLLFIRILYKGVLGIELEYCTYLPDLPSCWHTIDAPIISHESSQTVPHWLLTQISSRPSFSCREPLSLTCPVGQVVGEGSGQNTPTSLVWVQEEAGSVEFREE